MMNLTLDQVLALLGSKEVELYAARMSIEALKAEIASLSPDKEPKKEPE